MSRTGKVQTVLGLVEPDQIGVAFTHEHISMTFEVNFRQPPPGDEKNVNIPFEMKNLGWIRQYPYSHWGNLVIATEEDTIIDELVQFKKNGGGCIVENSTFGLNRKIEYVREASRISGVHIVAGTGYYVNAALPNEVHSLTVEDLAAKMTKDIVEGVDDTGIKCGVIGELGCTWPVTATERKVLEAGAAVQTSLGAPLIIHPGRDSTAPEDVTRILQEAGADLSRTVMSHLDRTIHDDEELLEFASMGTLLEYDLFGLENGLFQTNVGEKHVFMPNDGERIRRIKLLIDNGYLDKLFLAHDIHTKHRLVKYGGHGFSHILKVVLPMMRRHGYTQEMIDTMLIENPKKWLTFK